MKFFASYILALLVVGVTTGMVFCYRISFVQGNANTAVGFKYDNYCHEQNGKLGDLNIKPGTPGLYGGSQFGI